MSIRVLVGDVRDVLPTLPAGSIQCCVTSPPYWGLRDYGCDGQLGLEPRHDCLGWATGTPCGECYVCHMVAVFREVRRVLRDDGTLWLNLGDSYAGYWGEKYAHKPFGADRTPDASTPPHKTTPPWQSMWLKPKDLCGIPWRVAFALQADGWFLRAENIWAKPNPMPESVRDRTTRSHEQVFLLTKSARYYYDAEAVAEPQSAVSIARRGRKRLTPYEPPGQAENTGLDRAVGDDATRNLRSVWTIPTQPTPEAHFATFPQALVLPCLRAATSERGCCPGCGGPWERVVERTQEPDASAKGSRFDAGKTAARDGGDRTQEGERTTTRTVGWRPTCSCPEADPIPCTVLDPFFGAGTTGLVAERLGLDCIGVELSPAYAEITEARFNRQREGHVGVLL